MARVFIIRLVILYTLIYNIPQRIYTQFLAHVFPLPSLVPILLIFFRCIRTRGPLANRRAGLLRLAVSPASLRGWRRRRLKPSPYISHNLLPHTAYRITLMTLSYLQCHLLNAGLFKKWFFVQLCSSWQYYNWHSASRDFSAIAELFVINLWSRFWGTGWLCCRPALKGFYTTIINCFRNFPHEDKATVDSRLGPSCATCCSTNPKSLQGPIQPEIERFWKTTDYQQERSKCWDKRPGRITLKMHIRSQKASPC